MKNLCKKILLILSLALIGVTNLQADELDINRKKVLNKGIGLGAVLVNANSDSSTNMGFSFHFMRGDKFRYGGEISYIIAPENMEVGNLQESSGNFMDLHLRAGYAVFPDLDVWGSFGYGVMSDTLSGMVYGIGLHYGISDNWGVLMDAKMYDYSFANQNCDINSIALKLTYML
jgi:hypothetical protein